MCGDILPMSRQENAAETGICCHTMTVSCVDNTLCPLCNVLPLHKHTSASCCHQWSMMEILHSSHGLQAMTAMQHLMGAVHIHSESVNEVQIIMTPTWS